MTEESISTTAKKAIIPLIIKALWPILLSIILSIAAYLYSTVAEIVVHPQYKEYSLFLLAGLLGTTILFLILWIRLYREYGRFCEAFGVLWDKKLNMRCMSCRKPLKHSTLGPEVFWCSDPKCNSKYPLRDDNGNLLTKQEAISRIKNRCYGTT